MTLMKAWKKRNYEMMFSKFFMKTRAVTLTNTVKARVCASVLILLCNIDTRKTEDARLHVWFLVLYVSFSSCVRLH